MTRYGSILLWFPLAFLAFFLGLFGKLIKLSTDNVNSTYNEIVANKCSDSATLELLNSADVDYDYSNLEVVSIDPQLAVNDYGVMLCLSKGIQPTTDSVQNTLHDYIKLLTVCAYDGYYIYTNQKVSDTNAGLNGTPKLPYTYVDDSTGAKYALSLNTGKCWKFYVDGSGVPHLQDEVACPLSKDLANAAVNKRISDDLNARIQYLYDNGWNRKVYIPGEVSNISRVNPIQGPTVLALQTSDSMDVSFGIGGTRITQARKIVGYERDVNGTHIKFYAYSDKLPSTTVVIETFDSMAEAAKAGYQYDYQTMK